MGGAAGPRRLLSMMLERLSRVLTVLAAISLMGVLLAATLRGHFPTRGGVEYERSQGTAVQDSALPVAGSGGGAIPTDVADQPHAGRDPSARPPSTATSQAGFSPERSGRGGGERVDPVAGAANVPTDRQSETPGVGLAGTDSPQLVAVGALPRGIGGTTPGQRPAPLISASTSNDSLPSQRNASSSPSPPGSAGPRGPGDEAAAVNPRPSQGETGEPGVGGGTGSQPAVPSEQPITREHPFCPDRLPPGSSREYAEIMQQQYGCRYLHYCQSRNDGTGEHDCWWGAFRRPVVR